MPRRDPAAPKLLLSMVSAVLTTFTIIYGFTIGWLSIFMYYLYFLLAVYVYLICKGNRVATAYTMVGAITSGVFLVAVKLFDTILGLLLGIVTAIFVSFLADIILRVDWRYFSFDFDLSSDPMETFIQQKYNRHVPVTEDPAVPEIQQAEVQNSKGVIVEQPRQRKKSEKTNLSRREKRAELKRERREKWRSKKSQT